MKSIWEENCKFDKREDLKGNIKTDILVIGAGIAGILTGYLLKQSGKEVVLIDKSETASGNTKNTTAKITSQHDLIYDKLIKEFGEEKAKQYARANELAIKKYKEIIDERKIKCDFDVNVGDTLNVNRLHKIKFDNFPYDIEEVITTVHPLTKGEIKFGVINLNRKAVKIKLKKVYK